tara:strand:- start:87 stop:257 length:171 start_codon:yes stop_codon:yes gene_type:complete
MIITALYKYPIGRRSFLKKPSFMTSKIAKAKIRPKIIHKNVSIHPPYKKRVALSNH